MITRYSVTLIVLFIAIGIFTFGFITFGLWILYKGIFSSNDLLMFPVGMLLVWMGLGYLILVIGKIKTIEFRNGLLIIRKPFLNKYTEVELSKLKYLDFDLEMDWNTMKGILIKLENGTVEQISIKEYKNSKDFIDLIKNNCMRDETLRLKFWTKGLSIFLFTGLIILFVFIYLKKFK